jgi:hypothetical protein
MFDRGTCGSDRIGKLHSRMPRQHRHLVYDRRLELPPISAKRQKWLQTAGVSPNCTAAAGSSSIPCSRTLTRLRSIMTGPFLLINHVLQGDHSSLAEPQRPTRESGHAGLGLGDSNECDISVRPQQCSCRVWANDPTAERWMVVGLRYEVARSAALPECSEALSVSYIRTMQGPLSTTA